MKIKNKKGPVPLETNPHIYDISRRKSLMGYSLVEMVIYVSLVVIIMTAIIGVVVAVIKSNRYVGALNEIENSAILSLSRISREARFASGMTLINSSSVNFGTSTIYLDSGIIKINEDGNISPLTSSKISVSRLFFTKITSTSSTAIRIEMTLNASSSGWSTLKDFNTTTVLRGI